MNASRLVVGVLSLSIVSIATAGVSAAAWLSTGSGSATAKAATAQTSTISAVTASATDDLYPGAAKTTKITISNPNPYPVIVTAISSGSSTVVNTSCAAGTVTSDAVSNAAGIAQTSGVTTIAAGGSGTYQLATHMTATADNACQSQSFVLSLTASLGSNA